MKTTTLNTQIAAAGQQCTYRALINATTGKATHKLQIEIRTDSYAPQAYARISRHDGREWQPLAGILQPNMTTPKDLAYKPRAPRAADFQDDAATLLKMAELILA